MRPSTAFGRQQPNDVAVKTGDRNPRRERSRRAMFKLIQVEIDSW